MFRKSHLRQSSDSVWPLRNARGETFAQAKLRRELAEKLKAKSKRKKEKCSVDTSL
jgi:hypothetical protein